MPVIVKVKNTGDKQKIIHGSRTVRGTENIKQITQKERLQNSHKQHCKLMDNGIMSSNSGGKLFPNENTNLENKKGHSRMRVK